MNKIKLCQPVYKLKLPEHILIKDVLLLLIDETKSYKSKVDNIASLDWEDASNLKREWVSFFLPFWNMQVKNLLEDVNCSSIILHDIWFQQYEKGGEHGWHTHRGNFTGVYYLEFDKSSPKTEIIDPFSKRKITIKAKEGDMIFFPSHIRHRAPINNGKRKTIISWNFEVL
tara:strand:- start:866 stop:1378 length:513 start_codon:yes stop_codon:yes gene_type:complete